MLKIDNKNENKKHIEHLENIMKIDANIVDSIISNVNNGIGFDEKIIKDIVDSDPVVNEDIAIQMLLGAASFDDNMMSDDEKIEITQRYLIGNVIKIKKDDFLNDSFMKVVGFGEAFFANKNDIRIEMKDLNKYQIQMLDCQQRDRNFNTKMKLCYFDEQVKVPVLFKGNEALASFTPSEIATMKHHIYMMRGNVVVFGLGLGYFPYMCSLKDDVKSVTVVESNKDVISLFEENVLPKLESRDKIRIVNANPYHMFLDKAFMSEFNSGFVGMWRDCSDAIEVYSYFKEVEKINKTKMRYWLEEEIYTHLQTTLCAYILNTYSNNEIDLDNMVAPGYVKFLYKKLHGYFKSKKYIINNKDSMYKLLFDKKFASDVFRKPVVDKVS